MEAQRTQTGQVLKTWTGLSSKDNRGGSGFISLSSIEKEAAACIGD